MAISKNGFIVSVFDEANVFLQVESWNYSSPNCGILGMNCQYKYNEFKNERRF